MENFYRGFFFLGYQWSDSFFGNISGESRKIAKFLYVRFGVGNVVIP